MLTRPLRSASHLPEFFTSQSPHAAASIIVQEWNESANAEDMMVRVTQYDEEELTRWLTEQQALDSTISEEAKETANEVLEEQMRAVRENDGNV
jgi:DNA-binding PadR family transcriptional regulator